MVIPMVIKNERARIFSAGFSRMNSPIGFAKIKITTKAKITAVTITQTTSVNPIAVITESTEKTISRSTI